MNSTDLPPDVSSLADDRSVSVFNGTNKHLSHAQLRGVISLFNHYFREKNAAGQTKRLPSEEKKRRWLHYKAKMYNDYNRVIRGSFNSECALVKRYSDPLCFLKYKLKRSRNLSVNDLSRSDAEYYREIGGIDDIPQMLKRQHNIDSINKGITSVAKRRRIDSNIGANIGSNSNSNFNIYDDLSGVPSVLEFGRVDIDLSQASRPGISQAEIVPKREGPMNQALNQLNQNLNDYEKEKLVKQKSLAFEVTKEKMKAVIQTVTDSMLSQAHLLGLLPTSAYGDQLTAGFDLWLSTHAERIKQQEGITARTLISKLTTLKTDPIDFENFLYEWKLQRILNEDDFDIVWRFICKTFELSNREGLLVLDMDE